MSLSANPLEPEICSFSPIPNPPDSLDSQGICAIIGITGSHTGRVILDTTHETAAAFASVLLGRPADPDEALAGHLGRDGQCGMWPRYLASQSNFQKGMELRITPASLLEGKKLMISNLPNHHVLSVSAQTPIGAFLISMEMMEE